MELLILKNLFGVLFAVSMVYLMNRVYTVLSEMKEG
jgi:hypothetical protein